MRDVIGKFVAGLLYLTLIAGGAGLTIYGGTALVDDDWFAGSIIGSIGMGMVGWGLSAFKQMNRVR